MTPRASAGGIVVGPTGDIVLVHQWGNSWSFPKGGIEEGESALEAARREIYEEAGIVNLLLVDELGSYERYSIGPDGIGEVKEWGLRPRTIFLFRTDETELRPIDQEVTEARYVSLDEAIALLTHPKDREFLASVRERVESAR